MEKKIHIVSVATSGTARVEISSMATFNIVRMCIEGEIDSPLSSFVPLYLTSEEALDIALDLAIAADHTRLDRHTLENLLRDIREGKQ